VRYLGQFWVPPAVLPRNKFGGGFATGDELVRGVIPKGQYAVVRVDQW